MSDLPELGLIEGFFGPPWSWDERGWVVEFLGLRGYGFHIYAPKADAFLRRRWQEPHPVAEMEAMAGFSAACRAAGVRFGVGLSPFEAYLDFNAATRAALAAKLAWLDETGVDDLAILFDDMKGDVPDLARLQVEIVDFAAARTKASRIVVCPSYYSDDPVLDRVFGQRPPDYLRDLGRSLDPAIGIFWTGEEVCSREYSPGHLGDVAELLGRRPILWDNYPVNDGPRMSEHLHLRAFTGRPASLAREITAHAINPALQPVLGCIPALTLVESYRQGEGYRYGAAFATAAAEVGGAALAEALVRDLLTLQDGGRLKLGERAQAVRARYAAIDHAAAREVVRWIDGAYSTSAEQVQTQ
jgi:hyaluronoglucosaminidase